MNFCFFISSKGPKKTCFVKLLAYAKCPINVSYACRLWARRVDQNQVLCSQFSAIPSVSGEVYEAQTPQLPDNKCPTLSLEIRSCFSCPLGALRCWGNPFTNFLLCPL